MAEIGFYEAFRENMTALGQPCPEQVYGSVQSTVSAMTAIDAYITRFGRRVTVREMVIAGLRGEQLATLGTMFVSFYLGCVIGSLAVATLRKTTGLTVVDVLFLARQHNVYSDALRDELRRNSKMYSGRARSAAGQTHAH
jgi:hypothetical protein